MFFTVVLSGVLVMTLYVGWRAGSVPLVRRAAPWWVRWPALVLLGSAYMLARDAEERGWPVAARVLEFAGAYWVGILLLIFVAMLAADVATLGGLIFRRRLAAIRGWALVAGAVLALVAVVQGHRAPAVRDDEVRLAGLPADRDGTVLVFISDLHLGSMLGERWLSARVAQISALRPDAILVGGDVLEGDSASEAALVPLLGRLAAPLGVWAVPGNHEYHGGGASTLEALRGQGFRILRNEGAQLGPGLFLAGVDGGRERHGEQPPASPSEDPLALALAGRPPGVPAILLSHVPTRVEDASRAGVGLMLAGHTHDGQIWPFRYLVRTQSPYLAGRYEVGSMPLIVCRGTGTFGPRMRLWHRSEILRITLRRKG